MFVVIAIHAAEFPTEVRPSAATSSSATFDPIDFLISVFPESLSTLCSGAPRPPLDEKVVPATSAVSCTEPPAYGLH